MSPWTLGEEMDELHYQDTDSDVPEQRDSKCKVKWTQEEVSDIERQLWGRAGWGMKEVMAVEGLDRKLSLGCVCLTPQLVQRRGGANERRGWALWFSSMLLRAFPGTLQYLGLLGACASQTSGPAIAIVSLRSWRILHCGH